MDNKDTREEAGARGETFHPIATAKEADIDVNRLYVFESVTDYTESCHTGELNLEALMGAQLTKTMYEGFVMELRS